MGSNPALRQTKTAEASLTIRELTLTIHAPVNDAINAGQLLTIESGELTISAADDAIHCDYTLQIGAEGTDRPAISITDCCEGLEAATLNVASGDIRIRASDDCLNAANSRSDRLRFLHESLRRYDQRLYDGRRRL